MRQTITSPLSKPPIKVEGFGHERAIAIPVSVDVMGGVKGGMVAWAEDGVGEGRVWSEIAEEDRAEGTARWTMGSDEEACVGLGEEGARQ